MDYIDLVQWRAMVATVVAAWLVAALNIRGAWKNDPASGTGAK